MDEIQKFIRQLRKWNWIVFGLALFTALVTIAENSRLKREAERRAEYQELSERRLEQSIKDLEDLRAFNSWSNQYKRH